MFKQLLNKKLLKNEKGLTLIELLAVVVILAIIAAIAIPAIGNIINTQRDKAVVAEMSSIISGAKIAFADGVCKPDTACSHADLVPYVEKTKSESFTATFSAADKDWTISYKHKDGIKTDKIASLLGVATTGGIAAGTVASYKEDVVRKAMGE